MLTAMNQVIKVATKATAAPVATGRRWDSFRPTMLAVMAESTKTHSKPSRKTRTAMSRTATVELVRGAVGSGAPAAVSPCQTSRPITRAAATNRADRNPRRAGPSANGAPARDGMPSSFMAKEEVALADGKTGFILQFGKLNRPGKGGHAAGC